MADSASRTGTSYASAAILEYVERIHAPHDQALEATFGAPSREGMPPISLAPSEAKLLGLLARMSGAKRVVEVGTLAGYSAIALARGIGEGGQLHTIELEPRHADIARANIAAAELSAEVIVHVGPALEILPTLQPRGPFDLVFLDADKEGYPLYARWAADHLRVGGVLIADNAYYFGALLREGDDGAAAMRRFHEELPQRFESTCVPTPDGLVVAIRKR